MLGHMQLKLELEVEKEGPDGFEHCEIFAECSSICFEFIQH